MIIIFGHCFFPLPVEGADWLCQSATQALFSKVPGHEILGKCTRKGHFCQATEEPVFDTWLFGVPRILT